MQTLTQLLPAVSRIRVATVPQPLLGQGHVAALTLAPASPVRSLPLGMAAQHAAGAPLVRERGERGGAERGGRGGVERERAKGESEGVEEERWEEKNGEGVSRVKTPSI